MSQTNRKQTENKHNSQLYDQNEYQTIQVVSYKTVLSHLDVKALIHYFIDQVIILLIVRYFTPIALAYYYGIKFRFEFFFNIIPVVSFKMPQAAFGQINAYSVLMVTIITSLIFYFISIRKKEHRFYKEMMLAAFFATFSGLIQYGTLLLAFRDVYGYFIIDTYFWMVFPILSINCIFFVKYWNLKHRWNEHIEKRETEKAILADSSMGETNTTDENTTQSETKTQKKKTKTPRSKRLTHKRRKSH